jgi:dTDP-glucose 4,6-dehydratase
VTDIVSGFIAALDADEVVGEVINLGSGFEISIGDTVRVIADVMGTTVDVVLDEQRLRPDKSEVERLLSGSEKARRLLKWSPQFSGVEGFKRGLARTVEWFRNPANLARYKADAYNL